MSERALLREGRRDGEEVGRGKFGGYGGGAKGCERETENRRMRRWERGRGRVDKDKNENLFG